MTQFSKAGIMTNLEDDLSRRYSQAFQQYATLTRAFFAQWPPHLSPAAVSPEARLKDFTDTLSQWFQSSVAGESTDLAQHWNKFVSSLGVPGSELIGKQERISSRLFELAAECQRLQSQLSLHWATVGQTAAQRFAVQLQSSPPEAAASGEEWGRQLYSQWIDAAEKAYTESAHGSDYAALIAGLSNTVHAFKAEQSALMELWARQFNQPTRSEVDALNLQIKELREQIRDLRKQVDP